MTKKLIQCGVGSAHNEATYYTYTKVHLYLITKIHSKYVAMALICQRIIMIYYLFILNT